MGLRNFLPPFQNFSQVLSISPVFRYNALCEYKKSEGPHCMQPNYRKTRMACYRGYIVQGVINNLSPLFFVIFQRDYQVSYGMLSSLILFNFVTQILVDMLCVKLVDRVGYRAAAVTAHLFSTAGLLLLGLLPRALPSPFTGLAIATVVCAVGGGIVEVIVSPIIDSLPSEDKDAKMSLLHSFYCWGQVGVVLLTTLAVRLLGDGLWWVLPLVWAVLPAFNTVCFLRVPLRPTVSQEEKIPLATLAKSKVFLLAMVLMLCAGASELSMSQWSSLFAEEALGLPKVVGDLLGPCLFAVLMGVGRTIYGIWGPKLNLYHALLLTAGLCVLCYLGTALFPIPLVSLFCCALCGFSISLMWPGVLSSTSASYPKGGTAMFGVLAVCGDLGCSVGPALTGAVSEVVSSSPLPALSSLSPEQLNQLGLKAGMLVAAIFPLVLLLCLVVSRRIERKGIGQLPAAK